MVYMEGWKYCDDLEKGYGCATGWLSVSVADGVPFCPGLGSAERHFVQYNAVVSV